MTTARPDRSRMHRIVDITAAVVLAAAGCSGTAGSTAGSLPAGTAGS
ncbi:hypothetical protein ACFPJ4_03270 [Lysinimonas soli]|uniref:Uncharacterized protein n=1 Tax=Lysinimonas soli TaxID=1074233 RepID=A0ABW0NPW2_9MICO